MRVVNLFYAHLIQISFVNLHIQVTWFRYLQACCLRKLVFLFRFFLFRTCLCARLFCITHAIYANYEHVRRDSERVSGMSDMHIYWSWCLLIVGASVSNTSIMQGHEMLKQNHTLFVTWITFTGSVKIIRECLWVSRSLTVNWFVVLGSPLALCP